VLNIQPHLGGRKGSNDEDDDDHHTKGHPIKVTKMPRKKNREIHQAFQFLAKDPQVHWGKYDV